MKHIVTYLLIIILLFGFTSAYAQGVPAESPIILGGTGDDSLYDFLSLPNGNVILTITSSGGRNGAKEYAKRTRKAWIICLAPDGSTVWENEFGDDHAGGCTIFNHLMLGSDDTFSGMVAYSIDQRSQYRQIMTFSTIDGSFVKSGERITDTIREDRILRQFFTSQGYTVVLETHNCESTTEPRFLRMQDVKGNQLWELNAIDSGISHIEQFIPVTQGALLFGRNCDESSPSGKAVSMLVGNNGTVGWYWRMKDYDSSYFRSGIIDSQGRFIAVGIARTAPITDEAGHFAGYEDAPKLLIVCLDATTGTEIFVKATEMTNQFPLNRIIETEGQYILCGTGDNNNTIEYQTIDQSGNLLQHWSTSYPDCGLSSPRFFLWNGELWTIASLNGYTMAYDVFLERVVIP